MREKLNQCINTILENSKITSDDNSELYLIHLSTLLEAMGSLEYISGDNATPRSIKAATIGILNELFHNSYIEYIDPDTNNTVRINMLIFCKAITAVDTIQIYIYDRDAVEDNIPTEELSTTFHKIIAGKLNIIKTPIIIHYNSGTTVESENIDGNMAIRKYLDIFYSFGTKYGIAISGKSTTEYIVYSIYDMPQNLPFNDRIAIMLNYIDTYYLPDTHDKVLDMYNKISDNTTSVYTHPYSDIPKYMRDTFIQYVKTAITAQLTDAVSQATIKVSQDLNNLMGDLSETNKILHMKKNPSSNIHINELQLALDNDLQCGNSTQPSNTPQEKDTSEITDVITSKIGRELKEMGIYIENLTINTITIHIK